MIDCHCHILPGIDDGAASLEESVFLARKLVSYGFSKAVCTPHRSWLHRNTPEIVLKKCAELQRVLDELSVPLILVPSMEYRIIPETWPETVGNGWFLPWEGNHIIVELPISHPENIGDLSPEHEIEALAARGFRPVLAHPERCCYIDDSCIVKLKAAGAQMQLNIGAAEGFYGKQAQERAHRFLRSGFYDWLGSDTHNRKYTDFFDTVDVRGRLAQIVGKIKTEEEAR